MRVPALVVSLSVLAAACGEGAPVGPGDAAPSASPAADVASAPAPEVATPGTGPASNIPGLEQTAAPTPATDGEQGGGADWRGVVSTADAANLGRLDQAWRLARAEAEDRGFGDEVEALGPLVDPDAGQTGRLQPSPGAYRCRTINLGSKAEGGLAFIAYPYFRCTVALTPGGDLVLSKTTGSQRTRGLLYPDTDQRLVFVGAEAWGMDETGYPRYGQMPERDQVGVFERIGPNRWRLVLPWPKVDSKIEVLELTR